MSSQKIEHKKWETLTLVISIPYEYRAAYGAQIAWSVELIKTRIMRK